MVRAYVPSWFCEVRISKRSADYGVLSAQLHSSKTSPLIHNGYDAAFLFVT